jgi:hypothetical protein
LEKIDQNGYLQMYDVIHDMARDVVNKELLQDIGKHFHLWDFIDTKEILEKNKVHHSIYGYIDSFIHCFHSNEWVTMLKRRSNVKVWFHFPCCNL